MDFGLSEDVTMIRAAVKQFVDQELLPLEREYNYDEAYLPDEIRADLTQKVKDVGLSGLYVPKEYGGPGIGFVGRVAIAVQQQDRRRLDVERLQAIGDAMDRCLVERDVYLAVDAAQQFNDPFTGCPVRLRWQVIARVVCALQEL